MRRRNGTDLTQNEMRVLAAALRLRYEGVGQLYGYELFTQLCEWEHSEPMNHGTLYRCLRSLESRGALTSQRRVTDERMRVMYELTAPGVEAATKATLRLAALDSPPGWIDIAVTLPRNVVDGQTS